MSSKINVCGIIKGHLDTLCDINGKRSTSDLVTFFGIPFAAAFISLMVGFSLSEKLIELLVNFGSIFTALLLSVLVLVFDQEQKFSEADEHDFIAQQKKRLLRELYFNISFSIVCSVALVVLSLIAALMINPEASYSIKDFTLSVAGIAKIVSAAVVTLTTTIIINVLMVVKRMNVLLTTK